MALKGTLKDFGIADILQLIGQQQKTGVLYLKSKKKEVQVSFQEGMVVSVSIPKRKSRELIGEMLILAEMVDEEQIKRALEIQQRTLRRLGEILVEQNLITHERFAQIVQLQATEALYELFSWKSGTYEFDQRSVQVEPDSMRPMQPEAILLEAFRRLDEWPTIRRHIPSPHLIFDRVKDQLPQDDEGLAEPERTLFALINPSRDVQKLGEIACLGEFETRRALFNLLQRGYIRVGRHGPERSERVTLRALPLEEGAGSLVRFLVSAAIIGGLVMVISQMGVPRVGFSASPTSAVTGRAIERFIAYAQLGRIEAALEVYRVKKGQFPETLDSLVDVGLLERGDLSYPWEEAYYYRRVSNREFVLLPPLR